MKHLIFLILWYLVCVSAFPSGLQIHVSNSEPSCWDTVLLATVVWGFVCGHTISCNNLSPFSRGHYSLCCAVPIASLCDVSHQSPPFIHKGTMWPEAAGVSEGWCNLSSWLDSTRMNSSLDGTGSVLPTLLRSCCLERNCFGLSLVACLYSSGLSWNVVRTAAGQMSTCIFVSVCEPIHHISVSLLLIVPRDGSWSSAMTPKDLFHCWRLAYLFLCFYLLYL